MWFAALLKFLKAPVTVPVILLVGLALVVSAVSGYWARQPLHTEIARQETQIADLKTEQEKQRADYEERLRKGYEASIRKYNELQGKLANIGSEYDGRIAEVEARAARRTDGIIRMCLPKAKPPAASASPGGAQGGGAGQPDGAAAPGDPRGDAGEDAGAVRVAPIYAVGDSADKLVYQVRGLQEVIRQLLGSCAIIAEDKNPK